MSKINVYLASPMDDEGLEFLEKLKEKLGNSYEVVHASTHGVKVDFSDKENLDFNVKSALDVDYDLIQGADIAVVNYSKVKKYGCIDQGVIYAAGIIAGCGLTSFGYHPSEEKLNPFFRLSDTYHFTSVKELVESIKNYMEGEE